MNDFPCLTTLGKRLFKNLYVDFAPEKVVLSGGFNN